MAAFGKRAAVYCASSTKCAPEYHAAARRLGEVLAGSGLTVVYVGGAVGSMGALADGALACGGRVVGVLPRFMDARHGADAMWQVVPAPEDVPRAIADAPSWTREAQRFAVP